MLDIPKGAWYIYDQDDEGIFYRLGLIHMWRNGLIAFFCLFHSSVGLLTMGTWFIFGLLVSGVGIPLFTLFSRLV